MATATIEDYIKQIFLEQQRSGVDFVPMGKIATALKVAPGTVTTMVKSMNDAELLAYEPRRGAALTENGCKLALSILRRHRIVEVFLVEKLGFNWSEVHDEAERLEHALSDKVLERLDAYLGHPSTDPHGSPIPTQSGEYDNSRFSNLTECPINKDVIITRIESAKPTFLRYAESNGLVPTTQIRVTERDPDADSLTVAREDGETVTLGMAAAEKIFVR